MTCTRFWRIQIMRQLPAYFNHESTSTPHITLPPLQSIFYIPVNVSVQLYIQRFAQVIHDFIRVAQ